jgi:D-alanyl-D-alanine carboxypeptidase
MFNRLALCLALIILFTVNVMSQLAARMDKIASAVYKPGVPGAAIIVVRNGRVIFRKGYGLANLELKTPIRPEMAFRLASLTKQFTAAAIMMLAEQGKLSLTDDIARFFPAYKGKKITVENLLTHTSGIKDYLEKIWPGWMREDMRPETVAALFQDDPLEFEPGTRELYSNSNYILLGLIIEKLSGKNYGDFLAANIFKPLGMKHSCYETAQQIIPGRVSGYANTGEGYVNAAYVSTLQLYAAGGLVSSADDLALWDNAVNAGKLLRQSSWEKIFTPYKFANGETADYAFGWTVNEFQGRLIQSHGGGIPGATNFVIRMPQDHVYVAVLANDRTMEIQPEFVARRLAAIAIGKPIVEQKIIQLPAKTLDAYVGKYVNDDGEAVSVRQEGGRIFLQGDGDPEVEIFAIKADTFIVKAFEAEISFVRDAKGNVVQLVDVTATKRPLIIRSSYSFCRDGHLVHFVLFAVKFLALSASTTTIVNHEIHVGQVIDHDPHRPCRT